MSFQWSDNAVHIQSLYHPWYPNDGYDEAVVTAAEQKFGVRFPTILRNFYRSWAVRDDLTRRNQILLRPDDLFLQDEALIVCVENQWVWYWAIPYSALGQDNPPVLMARNEEPSLVWQPSHAHISDFLDYLTYEHAFDGGAIHGAYSQEWVNDELRMQMRRFGHERVLPTYPPWLVPGTAGQQWPLIVGEQYVLDGLIKVAVATNTSEILDHISESLQITWEHRW